jgi:hypothetical protein
VALAGSRLYVSFDASEVTAAVVRGGGGRGRIRAFQRSPLGEGALVPGATVTNVARAEEIREALRESAAAAPFARPKAVLVLPDGVARLAVVETPREADARDLARFRLAAGLPWPASESVVQILPVGRGLAVAAAIRRLTVAEYEGVASAAGLEVESVHLSPLLAVEGLVRRGRGDAVHVVLADAAVSFACFREGRLALLRSRRRDRSPGEAARLAVEARHCAALAGSEGGPIVSGRGAERLAEEIGVEPAPPPAGCAGWPDAAETAWLGGLVS